MEGLIAFAEYLMSNLASTWFQANLKQRQQIQRAIFPEGLPFDGQGFGTAVTCLAFNQLVEAGGSENGLASPSGIEPESRP